MRWLRSEVGILALFAGSNCIAAQTIVPTGNDNVTWDDDNWRIHTNYFEQGHYQTRLSLANGYLGINVANIGPFFEVDEQVAGDNINGWPLFNRRQSFATIAGFYNLQDRTNGTNYDWLYQYGGESVISGVPHWAGLLVVANNQTLDASVNASTISDFSATLDIKAGLASWNYTWTPQGVGPIKVEYVLFVHKLYVNQAAVQLKLTASQDTNVSVIDLLEGDCAQRTDFADKGFLRGSPGIWSAVHPNNLTNITAYIMTMLKCDSEGVDMSSRTLIDGDLYSGNKSTIAQSVPVSLSANQQITMEKYIGGASTDAFTDPRGAAENASLAAAAAGWDSLLKSHMDEWSTIMPPDSVDDYHSPNGSLPNTPEIIELQITAVTNPFYILQNTVGPNAIAAAGNNTKLGVDSIPVGGLTSDSYAGLVFWDADVWMAPGLQASHPEHVRQIPQFRVEKFPQAQQNVEMAFGSSQNETGKFSAGGAVYPWTSGRFGNCTGTGPCFDYEYHINGDIGLELYNYWVSTGDDTYFKNTLFPVYEAISQFYSQLLSYNETGDSYEILNATDPDEYANNVDNPGFTTALVQKHLNQTNNILQYFGLPINDTYKDRVAKIQLPVNKDADIITEYETMNGSISVKQADVILVDDILDYPNPYSLSDLDYYAAKQSQNGPGMTYAVFSIVANQMSPSGCSSFTYDIYSSQPYLRFPWFQYSEQLTDNFETNGGTHPAYPFLTGMGGANRVAIFGYLGLSLNHDYLDIDPSLPPQIERIDFRTFYWQGHAINATSNSTHTLVERLPQRSLKTANSKYANAPIPIHIGLSGTEYQLSLNTTLLIPNRQIGEIQTVANNLLQCQAVTGTNTAFMAGQFPLSAIDGAASTTWQPVNANDTSYITVKLGEPGQVEFYPIKNITFDWATSPPEWYAVYFSNVTQPPFNESTSTTVVTVTESSNVQISEPYDPSTAAVIERYVGNQTNVTLDKVVWSGVYAHLAIRGNLNSSETTSGATVAEWNVISERKVGTSLLDWLSGEGEFLRRSFRFRREGGRLG